MGEFSHLKQEVMRSFLPLIFNRKNYYVANVAFIIVVTPLLVYHTKNELGGSWLIPKVAACLGAGYIFGLKTCGNNSKGLTSLAFLTLLSLNFVHSFVDGIVPLNGSREKILALVGHELMRQPPMYQDFIPFFAIFSQNRFFKIIMSFICVTGVWWLAKDIGGWSSPHVMQVPVLHDIGEFSTFFFIGDAIHHVRDQGRGLLLERKKTTLPE